MLRATALFLPAVISVAISVAGCAERGAETAFADAWRYDAAGASAESVRAWSEFVDRFDDSPLAPIARERLAALAFRPAAMPAALTFAKDDYVCTGPGFYYRDARWCGRVRTGADPWYLVELGSLQLKTVWAFGFKPSTCTGNRYLGYFSYGTQVWVPRDCLVTMKLPERPPPEKTRTAG